MDLTAMKIKNKKFNLPKKCVLVFGSEGKGLAKFNKKRM